ncbi:MAG: DNA/RNA nuclease SfsA, partial [Rhodospirillales bacterium]|nr:DNA/RNA nuclease SfsA [Rhodospirillales bacterium]
WEMIRIGDAMVGVNTNRPNKLVAEAILDGTISELSGYASLRHEVKYGKNSRIDLLLEDDNRPMCYVEVKNVTMRRDLSPGAPADFPDSVTARGTKHLVELSDMVAEGHRATMMYLVQRDDAGGFMVASDIDPVYANALTDAVKAGVEVICYDCKLDETEITVNKPLKIQLP